MKLMRIVISIVFVLLTVASLYVFISEKSKVDKTLPQITVEGDIIEVSLKATDEELLKGITAFDEKDGDLTYSVIVESISRFTKEKGECKVVYSVCDSNNNVAKATRKIKYIGYESPKFKIKGNLCFSLYERIDLRPFVFANDCLEGNITDRIVITSENYSTSVEGVYYVDASVTNKKGDTSTIQLPLIVEDRPISAPEIILSEYLVYSKKGQAINFESYLVDALDYKETSLKNNVTIDTDFNPQASGTYHVHYYVTDNQGNRGHSVLTVIVGE